MSSIFNKETFSKTLIDVSQSEINKLLDNVTDEMTEIIVTKYKARVRRMVAVKMIAMLEDNYSMEYIGNELRIKVMFTDESGK